jgi:hypothetical protein
LKIENEVFLHPFRPDFPTLIVDGRLELHYESGSKTLSESSIGKNLNPAGAPYNGLTDSSNDDSYPSEIQGLVHVTGDLDWHKDARVRGLVLCESTAGSNAADLHNKGEVIYTPSLFTNPPQWYTTDVKLLPVQGSWMQLPN